MKQYGYERLDSLIQYFGDMEYAQSIMTKWNNKDFLAAKGPFDLEFGIKMLDLSATKTS
jgi:hypothetical protein